MYTPPIQDQKFIIEYLIGFDTIARQAKIDNQNQENIDKELIWSILEEAGKFASNILAPINHSGDKQNSIITEEGDVRTPDGFREAYKAMCDAGWTTLEAKSEWGGQQMPMSISAAVCEMWHSANMSFALCHLLSQGQIYALQKSASEEQKKKYLPNLVSGKWTGTMNLTEPQAGTDLSKIRTKAVREGNHYKISGQKIYITYGEHDMAENIIHLVLARTPDAPEGIKGISLFIVPKILFKDDGSLDRPNDVRCISIEKKLGIKGSPTAVLQYGDNGGAIGYLVGEENKGLEIMFSMMNHARFNVGLQGLAIAERAYQQAVVYAETRVQGTPLAQETGVPINRHPDVLRLLSVMRSEIDAMRALIFTGANAMDIADNTVSEVIADEQKRASVLIPIIKGWITELSVFHCSNGLQVHGGMGFIEETGAAQYLRDSRILPIYEGTTAIQANDLIFRKTIRDEGRTIRNLLDEIETEISLVDECYSVPMSNAIAEVRSTLEILLSKANDSRYLAANGVNWLMQLGYLCGGWMAVKSADRAMKNAKYLSDDFVDSKKICAEIYLQHSLPHVGTFLNVINHEDNSILNMNVNWLHRQTA
ncbi:acyl-CoA dehydrogenase family protein [Alphaproteobacteria bacterium]|nr:acyl-CoA dehydrogenase family protein [Alphaproteobacteria bacterium]